MSSQKLGPFLKKEKNKSTQLQLMSYLLSSIYYMSARCWGQY